jgi:hypothetical protein
MRTGRRAFISKISAATVGATTLLRRARGRDAALRDRIPTGIEDGSSGSERIRSVFLRKETFFPYGGDCTPAMFTWTEDDRQVGAALDGPGYPEIPKDHYRTSTLLAMRGDSPQEATFEGFPGYPDISMWEQNNLSRPAYYGFSTLAVDSHLYHFLSTLHLDPAPNPATCKRHIDCLPWPWNGAKLIYSPDNGRTWHNENGTTPVVLESWSAQTRDSITFLEPDGAFAFPMFLQMGKAYSDNRDGYVYVYGNSGITEGTMNQLVLFRVPKHEVANRSKYEYFVKRLPNGDAIWTKDIKSRGATHTFPSGYVNKSRGCSWIPSVIYNAPLSTYMLCAGGDASDWWAETPLPGYFGIWVSSRPWGPWRQIHEQIGSDGDDTLPGFVILPKWISQDGMSFWISRDGGHGSAGTSASVEEQTLWTTEGRTAEEQWLGRLKWRLYNPWVGFNFQLVELAVE